MKITPNIKHTNNIMICGCKICTKIKGDHRGEMNLIRERLDPDGKFLKLLEQQRDSKFRWDQIIDDLDRRFNDENSTL